MDKEKQIENQEKYDLNKKNQSYKNIIILILVIISILLLMIGYFYVQNKDNDKSVEKLETADLQVLKWNKGASYQPDEDFYNNSIEEIKYTNIATLKTGEIIIRASDIWSDDYFLIDANNNVVFLEKYSSPNLDILSEDIKIDKKIMIPEIFPEEDIIYKGQTFKFDYHGSKGLDHVPNEAIGQEVLKTKYGNLYEYKYFINDDLYVVEYYLKTPDKDGTHYYTLGDADIYNDDRTINVQWDDISNESITWQMPISSCGNNGSRLHVKDFTKSFGTKVGTTKMGKPLYKLTDDRLLKMLYDEYFIEDMETFDSNRVSFKEYKTILTTVVYQDNLGEWIALQNDQYSHAAECGKPVIYLYPENDTYVNVEVGANITISEPLYVKEGWKNVFAKPNGTLTYKGKIYDSLFWEGLGFGKYPNINDVGKVVTQDKLIPTIIKDLEDQGLNKKEITDFIEFWKDNLPKAPYVKLSWFTTEQMNVLAPLKVSPKPDTVIRVFLDAKGLEKPVTLNAQVFNKTKRTGFTLVEWGGLLFK